jgi:hypothetical protein
LHRIWLEGKVDVDGLDLHLVPAMSVTNGVHDGERKKDRRDVTKRQNDDRLVLTEVNGGRCRAVGGAGGGTNEDIVTSKSAKNAL